MLFRRGGKKGEKVDRRGRERMGKQKSDTTKRTLLCPTCAPIFCPCDRV